MGRSGGRVRRDGGSRAKRDTPVKAAAGKRQKLRTLEPRNVYEALPEEPDAEETHVPALLTINIEPVHGKTLLAARSAAFSESPRDQIHPSLLAPVRAEQKPGHRASPSGPAVQMSPEPEAFKSHSEAELKEKEQDGQKLAASPESVISSSLESDTTFNSDDDDDDRYSSTFSSSNTLPSPEIFRSENTAETGTFCIKALHLDLYPIIRNSTLLDVSCAQSIRTHQPPDLSAIISVSPLLAEKCEISNNREPEDYPQIKQDFLQSDKDVKCKTPAKLTRKKPILCKKVVFKSPIMTEFLDLEVTHTPATKCTIRCTPGPVHTLSPAAQMKPAENGPRPGEMNSKDDTLLLSVNLKRPVRGSAEKAKFFDFVSDKDEDAFFRMARERSVKLRSAPLFPLTAAKRKLPSVW